MSGLRLGAGSWGLGAGGWEWDRGSETGPKFMVMGGGNLWVWEESGKEEKCSKH